MDKELNLVKKEDVQKIFHKFKEKSTDEFILQSKQLKIGITVYDHMLIISILDKHNKVIGELHTKSYKKFKMVILEELICSLK